MGEQGQTTKPPPGVDQGEKNPGDKVFGGVVNKETVMNYLKDMEFDTVDMSYLTYKLKKADKKDEDALNHVKSILPKNPDQQTSYTLCTIYNATGRDLELYKSSHDYKGSNEGGDFPKTIANGQWAAVLHKGPHGSSAAVIYQGQNKDGDDCAWLHAWKNEPGKKIVFTEIKNPEHYSVNDWDSIASLIEHDGSFSAADMGCHSKASSIREEKGGNTYIYSGIMTLNWCFPEVTS